MVFIVKFTYFRCRIEYVIMVNQFLQYLQYEKNYSSYTILSYRTDMYQFCRTLQVAPSQLDPNVITSQQIQRWILSLMSSGISSRTLSRKISTLKSFWKFLLVRSYVENNPTLKIILPKTKKPLPAFFKESEMVEVLSKINAENDFESVRNQLILSVFYLTGVRLSELMNIKINDIDLSEGNLKVVGKRNKERIIPIGRDLCDEIERYLEVRADQVVEFDSFFFLRKNGKKMYSRLLYTIVHDRMSQVSCLHKRSPHVLRHTFATEMLNGGADINVVKDFLGHSSLAATQIYTHASFEELHNIYKLAHPRAK